MKILHSALLAAAAFAGISANAAADPAQPYLVTTRLGVSSITLFCGPTNLLGCHYLILTSLCHEKMLDGGTKERICSYKEAVPPFALRPGEKKSVGKLPADFVYAMKSGSKPTFDEVLRSPAPH
jgi:hypothetical protein